MLELSGYTITDKLGEDLNSIIYRGYGVEDKRYYLFKVLRGKYPDHKRIAQFRHEYEIAKDLNFTKVIRPCSFFNQADMWILMYEDFRGDSLKTILTQRKLTITDSLQNAIKIVECLAELHGHQIVHLDIKPTHILVNSAADVIKLTGLSSAIRGSEGKLMMPPTSSFGTSLLYISPEQTGRTNRQVDYRSDFYSVGAVFYEMLVGYPPFQSHNTIELIYCHIAKVPLFPHVIDAAIPESLSRIAMKLLAKNPPDRYQSIHGIKADLAFCLQEWTEKNQIAAFTCGEHDISDKLHIPLQFYGRDRERRALLNTLEHLKQGGRQFFLLCGDMGVGKSTLVKRCIDSFQPENPYFIASPCDFPKRHIAYSTLNHIFTALVQHLLTKDEQTLTDWRATLLGALDNEGQILTNRFPVLEQLLGTHHSTAILNPEETQDCLEKQLQSFMTTFCQRVLEKEHHSPLVIFLQDIQWIDIATWHLLEVLLNNDAISGFLIIGSYREGQQGLEKSFFLKNVRFPVQLVYLKSWQLEEIIELLVDTLKNDSTTLIPLAQVIFKKTGGNPLAVKKFLKHIQQRHLLYFLLPNEGQETDGNWQWNLEKIAEVTSTDEEWETAINDFESSESLLEQAASPLEKNSHLEVASLMQMVQTISEEVVFEPLVRKLMQIVVENSGAQTGYLILLQAHHFLLQAAFSLDFEEVKVFEALPLESLNPKSGLPFVPLAIINFVLRSREQVVINHPNTAHLFMADSYLRHYQPQSLLCLPMVYHRELVGALYLENSLISNTFTPDRVAILHLLSSQIAIALKNARLYEQYKENNRKLLEFKHSLDATIDSVLIFDADTLHFLYANQGAVKHLGYTLEELLSMSLMDIDPNFDREKMYQLLAPLRHKQVSSVLIETVQRHHGGHAIPVEVLLQYIENAEGHGRFIGIVRNITERKQYEESLKKAKIAAETANQVKNVFLANMSHELRTPLNAILGQAQNLRREFKLDKQIDSIDIILRSGEYLLLLINDILDLSKIEAGDMRLYPTDFNLEHFLSSIVTLFQMRANQKKLSFIYQPVSALPLAINADEKRMRQILTNLLSNAVKFTERGGIHFKVGYERAVLLFDIEDSGVGIPKEELETIFLPFQRACTWCRDNEGIGLGLYITKKLIDLMGGQLQVESKIHQGTRFRLTLPVSEISSTAKISEKEPLIAGYELPPVTMSFDKSLWLPTQRLQREKILILIIDDQWENRLILSELLKPIGFEVLEACNGQEGVHLAQDYQPDLIIIDLVMPIMDGFEAIRQMRKMIELQNISIVATSTSILNESVNAASGAGCTIFLSKPFRREILLTLLKQQLHLNWIYKNPPILPVAEEMDNCHTVPTVGPAAEEAEALFNLAMMGDFSAILEKITVLEQTNKQLAPFTHQIRRLAKEFRDDEICALIQPFMGNPF